MMSTHASLRIVDDAPQPQELRGADLRGHRFAFASLEGVSFDGARLDGATFEHVELTGASFRNAELIGATFRHVAGSGVSFAGARARDARWDRSSLQLADFTGARLKRARLVGCELEESIFDGADLTLGSLAASTLDRARFGAAVLRHTETLDATFTGADLSSARDFAYCREIVLEILRRHTERELEMSKMIGAIAQLRTWCYPVWAQLLTSRPAFFATAIRVFGMYPASGCLEAFVDPLKAAPAPSAT